MKSIINNGRENIPSFLPSFIPSFGLAFLSGFMLIIYAPLELLFTNEADFWFTGGQIFPTLLAVFLAWLVCMSAVLLLLRQKAGKLFAVVFALVTGLTLAAYIQANFLAGNIPALDGTVVDWSAYPAERVKSAAVWLLCPAAAVAAMRVIGKDKFEKYTAYGAAALTFILAVTLVTLNFTAEKMEKENTLVACNDELGDYSSEKNLIILLLDATNGADVQTLIESGDFSGYEDFTFYRDAMSCYPYTRCSVAQILTGEKYLAQGSFFDYSNAAFNASPMLSKAEADGFRVGLYFGDNYYLSPDTFAHPTVNLHAGKSAFSSKSMELGILRRMMLLKPAPWDLKRGCYNLTDALSAARLPVSGTDAQLYDYSNGAFFDVLKSGAAAEGTFTEPCLKFIHLEGSHTPFLYDRNMQRHTEDDQTSYDEQLRGVLMMTGLYLDELKQAGVYDNSAIVILADHGFNGDEVLGRQAPMLMVKGIGEKHGFAYSDLPISYDELQSAFVKLMDGAASGEIFTGSSERFLYSYNWMNLYHFEEYVQTGSAEDMTTLVPTGTVYERK